MRTNIIFLLLGLLSFYSCDNKVETTSEEKEYSEVFIATQINSLDDFGIYVYHQYSIFLEKRNWGNKEAFVLGGIEMEARMSLSEYTFVAAPTKVSYFLEDSALAFIMDLELMWGRGMIDREMSYTEGYDFMDEKWLPYIFNENIALVKDTVEVIYFGEIIHKGDYYSLKRRYHGKNTKEGLVLRIIKDLNPEDFKDVDRMMLNHNYEITQESKLSELIPYSTITTTIPQRDSFIVDKKIK